MKKTKKLKYLRSFAVFELDTCHSRYITGGSKLMDYLHDHQYVVMAILAFGSMAFLFDGIIKSGQNSALCKINSSYPLGSLEKKVQENSASFELSAQASSSLFKSPVGPVSIRRKTSSSRELKEHDVDITRHEAIDSMRSAVISTSLANEGNKDVQPYFQRTKREGQHEQFPGSLCLEDKTLNTGTNLLVEEESDQNPEPKGFISRAVEAVVPKVIRSFVVSAIERFKTHEHEIMCGGEAAKFMMDSKVFKKNPKGFIQQLKKDGLLEVAKKIELAMVEADNYLPLKNEHTIYSSIEKRNEGGFYGTLVKKDIKSISEQNGSSRAVKGDVKGEKGAIGMQLNDGEGMYPSGSMQLHKPELSLAIKNSINEQYKTYTNWLKERQWSKAIDLKRYIFLYHLNDLAFEAQIIEKALDPSSSIKFGYDEHLPINQKKKIIEKEFFKKGEEMIMGFLNSGAIEIRGHVFYKAYEEKLKNCAWKNDRSPNKAFFSWVLNESPLAYYFSVQRECLEMYKKYIESCYKASFVTGPYVDEMYGLFGKNNCIIHQDLEITSKFNIYTKNLPNDYPYTLKTYTARIDEWASIWGYKSRRSISIDEDEVIKSVLCFKETRLLKSLLGGESDAWKDFKRTFLVVRDLYKDNSGSFPNLPEFHYWVIHKSPLEQCAGSEGLNQYKDYIKQYYKINEVNTRVQPPLNAKQLERWSLYRRHIRLQNQDHQDTLYKWEAFTCTFYDLNAPVEEELSWLQKHLNNDEAIKKIQENLFKLP